MSEKGSAASVAEVYAERNQAVAALAALAFAFGYKAWIAHDDAAAAADANFGPVVMIELPTGQVSWHVMESEMPMFRLIANSYGPGWDGHSDDLKRRRLVSFARGSVEPIAE